MFDVIVVAGESGHALQRFVGAFQIRGIRRIGHEEQAVEINGERVYVIGVGFEIVEIGVSALYLGFEFWIRLRLVHRRLVLALGGFSLDFFDAPLIVRDGVLLALIGADKFHARLVGFAQLEIIQCFVRVQHDAVVGAAGVGQVGLVGKQRAGLVADFYPGFLRVLVNAILRLIKRLVTGFVLAIAAQHVALFQPPDHGVLVIGILV